MQGFSKNQQNHSLKINSLQADINEENYVLLYDLKVVEYTQFVAAQFIINYLYILSCRDLPTHDPPFTIV